MFSSPVAAGRDFSGTGNTMSHAQSDAPAPATAADAGGAAPDARGPIAGWVIAFVAALMLYGLTATREIQWQDYGALVLRIVRGELISPLGLALTHPLQHWLGRAAVRVLPVEPPHAVALVSALGGAMAVANVFGLTRQLTGSTLAACLAAAGLAVAHTFWHLSTLPESYSLATALLTAELWALAQWDRTRRPRWLALMFLFNGLGFANHNLALLTLPVVGVVLIAAIRSRAAPQTALGWAAAAWLAGASPYLALVAQQAIATGDPGGAVHSALFGKYQGAVLSRSVPLRATALSVAFSLLSFPNLMLPAGALGAARARRVGVPGLTRRALTAALLIHTLFVFRYDVVDQYTFLLPTYAIIAVLAGVGFAVALRRWAGRGRAVTMSLAAGSIALTPVLYLFTPGLARSAGVLGDQTRNKPYRDDYQYLFTAWGSGDDSAARLSRHAADLAAGPDTLLVVQDGMALFAVQYELWRRGLAGTQIVARADADEVRQALEAGRRVVLVPARADGVPAVPPGGEWRPDGELFILQRRNPRNDAAAAVPTGWDALSTDDRGTSSREIETIPPCAQSR
jgi:hypothetical protein